MLSAFAAPAFRRLAAVLLSGLSALFLAFPASALTVTLVGASGSSCTYSTINVASDGNVSVTCAGTAGDSFALGSNSYSLAPSSVVSSTVSVVRLGGTQASTVYYSISGTGCATANNNPVTFGANDSAPKYVSVTTTASGTCTISLANPTVGTIGSPSSASINVSNPDSNVVFAVGSATPLSTSWGGSGVTVNVTRTGGSNGTWTVPYTLSGSLTTAGALIANAGSFTGTGSLTFTANSAPPTMPTYNPPSTAPAGITAGDIVVTLGTPTPVGTPPGTQTASLGSPVAQTINVSTQVGCPTVSNIVNYTFGNPGSWVSTLAASTNIAVFTLPAPVSSYPNYAGITYGVLTGSQTALTPSPLTIEVAISKCPGDMYYWTQQPRPNTATPPTCGSGESASACFTRVNNLNGVTYPCYYVTSNPSGLEVKWSEISNTALAYCHAPTSQGPWYVNVRMTYPSCAYGACGISFQWN